MTFYELCVIIQEESELDIEMLDGLGEDGRLDPEKQQSRDGLLEWIIAEFGDVAPPEQTIYESMPEEDIEATIKVLNDIAEFTTRATRKIMDALEAKKALSAREKIALPKAMRADHVERIREAHGDNENLSQEKTNSTA